MLDVKVVQVGGVLLPLAWLVSMLVLWVGSRLADKLFPLTGDGRSWVDLFFHSFVVYMVVFKLSPFLFRPAAILDNPASVLFANPSDRGMMVAVLVTLLETARQLRKQKISFRTALDAGVWVGGLMLLAHAVTFKELGDVTTMPWGITFAGTGYHPVHLYRALLLVAVLGIWGRYRNRWGEGSTFAWMATAAGTGWLFLTLFEPTDPISVIYGLSIDQWGFAVLAIGGWVSWIRDKRGKVREKGMEA